MKAKELIDKKSEILEPLHLVAMELAEVDRRGKNHLIEYTRLDVIAASVAFIHILANKKAHSYYKKNGPANIEQVKEEMEGYGKRIGEIVYEMSGVKLNEGKQDEQ